MDTSADRLRLNATQRPRLRAVVELDDGQLTLELSQLADDAGELVRQAGTAPSCRCAPAYRLADTIARGCPLHGPELPGE